MTTSEKKKFAVATAEVDEADFSDEDALGFYEYKQKYVQRTKRRAEAVEISEGAKKRKRR